MAGMLHSRKPKMIHGPGELTPEPSPDAAQAPPRRRTPVKGLCTYCGKNWSRHWARSDGHADCTAEGQGTVFTPRTEAPPQAPAATATAGGLTEAQWARINVLAEDKEQALLAQHAAADRLKKASAAWSDYMDSLRSLAGGK